MLKGRKKTYKQNGMLYYRPWIFLITDGAPIDGDLWRSAAQRIKAAEKGKKVSLFAVGVEGADMGVLAQVGLRKPLALRGHRGRDFIEMFLWLSGSIQLISHSKLESEVPLQTPLGWGKA
jgi:uncharacterized protein YegL